MRNQFVWPELYIVACHYLPPPCACRINVFALIGFHLTLSDDLDDLYVAELEEIEETGQTKTDLPTKIPL